MPQGGNFTNILRADFPFEIVMHIFYVLTFVFVIFLAKINFHTKAAHKMFVKLTEAINLSG